MQDEFISRLLVDRQQDFAAGLDPLFTSVGRSFAMVARRLRRAASATAAVGAALVSVPLVLLVIGLCERGPFG
ncbi:hypothetical protein FSZ31_02870 [Sphingorhabdus soli]|uniref:Uncharacterized protein n=1 Tax=Flavisphingopyxis soli TaxID=2601267 RepID=A0A5C6USB4_9SPHN|nr:hypothetical protein [Sphingorhabdus soli]TXC73695.1 hypothetical protein FSZ31_02870 [Sphingorhabdus soli]